MLAKSGKELRVYKYAYELAEDEHQDLTSRCIETGPMIGGMLHKASSFDH